MELVIKGMNCGHCERAVEAVLAAQPGISAVRDVDATRGAARVTGTVERAALAEALRAEGYELVDRHGEG